MALDGPIILIEDDEHDVDVISAAIKEDGFKAEIRSFTFAKDAMDYLMTTTEKPFVILCDIRLQGMNGLEFRRMLSENEFLRKKSIPFVFFTAAASDQIVNEAYNLDVQGFFKKPASFDELKAQLKSIIYYWKSCLHPNV